MGVLKKVRPVVAVVALVVTTSACSDDSTSSGQAALLAGASSEVVSDLCTVLKPIEQQRELADYGAMKASYSELVTKSSAATGVDAFEVVARDASEQFTKVVQVGSGGVAGKDAQVASGRLAIATDRMKLACLERDFPVVPQRHHRQNCQSVAVRRASRR